MIADGTISGGMIPKVETAVGAVEKGVRAAVILDGKLPNAALLELFTEHGAGSIIRSTEPRVKPPERMTGLAQALGATGLMVSGTCPTGPDDGLGRGTLHLLSPREPDFWDIFAHSPEYRDGQPDPMDRWSRRVITTLAEAQGWQALFPFGGPPYRPFHSWALRTGRFWSSPIGFLVHDAAGLMVSFRGALLSPEVAEFDAPAPAPCPTCIAPCRTACPVDAFADGYDVARCKDHVRSPAGIDCRTGGCLARRACPVGAGQRQTGQAVFHMEAFPLTRVILIRHAKSSWEDAFADDHARDLTDRGRQAATAIGQWLADKGYRPDVVLCSDATRTHHTALRILKAFDPEPELKLDPALYHASPDTILDAIRAESAGTIAVIGHNPGIGLTAQGLVTLRPDHNRFGDYPTAATTVIDFSGPVRPHTGSCIDFVIPADLGVSAPGSD